jgi:hypothetical protein
VCACTFFVKIQRVVEIGPCLSMCVYSCMCVCAVSINIHYDSGGPARNAGARGARGERQSGPDGYNLALPILAVVLQWCYSGGIVVLVVLGVTAVLPRLGTDGPALLHFSVKLRLLYGNCSVIQN